MIKRVGRRQLKFLGYILGAEELKSDCLLGRNDGKRAGGREWTKYLDNILVFLGGRKMTTNMIRLAEERRNWRSMVDYITRWSLR